MSMSREAASAESDAVHRARAVVQSLYLADLASQSLGIEIIDVAPGRVQIAMTVRPDMVNGHGMCHGGVIFAFADSAFAFACNSYGDPMVAAGAMAISSVSVVGNSLRIRRQKLL